MPETAHPIDTPPQLAPDTGLLGLVLLAQFHGVAANPSQLSHQFGRGTEPFNETELLLTAKSLELKARIIKQSADRVGMAALPALALSPTGAHFIIARTDGDKILIHDLKAGRPAVLTQLEFAELYDGRLLVIASTPCMDGTVRTS